MKLDKKTLAILAFIFINVIWGAALPIAKWTLDSIPPFTFSFLRFLISALIIFPFVIKKLHISTKDLPILIFTSIVSITIQIPLLLFGLSLSPSINAPIIISSGPVILIIASIIFLKEKVSRKLILGTLVSLFGVTTLIIGPALNGGFGGNTLGSFFIFLATICGVIQAILFKKLTDKYEPLPLVFYSFLIGSISLIPFSYIEYANNAVININFQAFIGLFYTIIFSSILAHILFLWGLKYIHVSEVGLFSYVDPIATIMVAVPLLNETITPAYAIAAFLVFGGIFIAEGRLHYHPVHKLAALFAKY